MQRFKAWLFVWLMGEHFNEIERRISHIEQDNLYHFDEWLRRMESNRKPMAVAEPSPKKKVIQSRNWADFQRLAGDSDQEVQ